MTVIHSPEWLKLKGLNILNIDKDTEKQKPVNCWQEYTYLETLFGIIY